MQSTSHDSKVSLARLKNVFTQITWLYEPDPYTSALREDVAMLERLQHHTRQDMISAGLSPWVIRMTIDFSEYRQDGKVVEKAAELIMKKYPNSFQVLYSSDQEFEDWPRIRLRLKCAHSGQVCLPCSSHFDSVRSLFTHLHDVYGTYPQNHSGLRHRATFENFAKAWLHVSTSAAQSYDTYIIKHDLKHLLRNVLSPTNETLEAAIRCKFCAKDVLLRCTHEPEFSEGCCKACFPKYFYVTEHGITLEFKPCFYCLNKHKYNDLHLGVVEDQCCNTCFMERYIRSPVTNAVELATTCSTCAKKFGESSLLSCLTDEAQKKYCRICFDSEFIRCGVCLEYIRIGQSISLPGCDCVYCKDDFNSLWTVSMTSQTTFPPKCCGKMLRFSDHVTQLQPEARQRFAEVIDEFAAGMPIYCASTTCGAFIKPGLVDVQTNIATCSKCWTCTCTKCRQLIDAHTNQSNSSCTVGTNDNMLRIMARDNHWRACPSCNTMIDRTEGCNHMRCNCGQRFCYACGVGYEGSPLCGCGLGLGGGDPAAAVIEIPDDPVYPQGEVRRRSMIHFRWNGNATAATCTHQAVGRRPGPHRCAGCLSSEIPTDVCYRCGTLLCAPCRTQHHRQIIEARERHGCLHIDRHFIRTHYGVCEGCWTQDHSLNHCNVCDMELCSRCLRREGLEFIPA